PLADWENPRPGHRKAVRVEFQPPHQFDVVTPAMVMIARDVARIAVVDAPGLPAKAVPDGFPAAVFGHGSFDLIRGRRGSPEKAFGKAEHAHGRLLRCGRRRGAAGDSLRRARARPGRPALGAAGVERQRLAVTGQGPGDQRSRANASSTRWAARLRNACTPPCRSRLPST